MCRKDKANLDITQLKLQFIPISYAIHDYNYLLSLLLYYYYFITSQLCEILKILSVAQELHKALIE